MGAVECLEVRGLDQPSRPPQQDTGVGQGVSAVQSPGVHITDGSLSGDTDGEGVSVGPGYLRSGGHGSQLQLRGANLPGQWFQVVSATAYLRRCTMTLSKDSPVTDLNLPDKLRLRILNCLKMEGCDDIGDILAKPHRDLKLCP